MSLSPRSVFPLFETIRAQDGMPLHLEYHAERISRSRRELFGIVDTISEADLKALINVPEQLRAGRTRVRIPYGRIFGAPEYFSYTLRTIRRLVVIDAPALAYQHKYTDRSALDALRESCTADEEPLICSDGLIRETRFSSIVLYDGGEFVTPAAPLLPGTAIARLLCSGNIRAAALSPGDLAHFRELHCVNAMLELGDLVIPLNPGTLRWS